MNPKKYGILLLFILSILLVLSACELPKNGEEVDLEALATQVVLTVEAEVRATLLAQAETEKVEAQSAELTQNAALPADNQASGDPTLTPSPTNTPAPTATFTPASPQVSVSVDTNCRTGPGQIYDWIGSLTVGQVADVIAVPLDSRDYVVIKNPNGGRCWLWLEYATITGDVKTLPQWDIPPTPTPIPGSIAGTVWNDLCKQGPDPDDVPDGCVKPEVAGDPFPSNGTFDSGEKTFAGIEIWLGTGACPAGGKPISTLTDSSGVYKFVKVLPGTYCLRISATSGPNTAILTPGKWRTPVGGSMTVELGHGEDKTGLNFGWDFDND